MYLIVEWNEAITIAQNETNNKNFHSIVIPQNPKTPVSSGTRFLF